MTNTALFETTQNILIMVDDLRQNILMWYLMMDDKVQNMELREICER